MAGHGPDQHSQWRERVRHGHQPDGYGYPGHPDQPVLPGARGVAVALLGNNGTIDIINGGVTNFHGWFTNNGTVLTAGRVAISSIFVTGNNVNVQIPSVPGHTYQLQFSSSLAPT